MRPAGLTRLFKVTAIFGAAIAIALSGAWIYRVPVAQFMAETALRYYGFPNGSVHIVSLGTTGLSVQNLVLDQNLTIQKISATYQIPALFDGEIEKISIERSFVNLSNPATGALSRILERVKSGGAAAPKMRLPNIQFKDAVFQWRKNAHAVSAKLDGHLDADLNLQAIALIDGQIGTGTELIILSETAITLEGNIENQDGRIVFQGARLKQAGAAPIFAPLEIGMTVILSKNTLSFDAEIQSDQGVMLAKFNGVHTLDDASGRAGFTIENLSLNRDGLQLEHLIPVIRALPAIDVNIQGDGDLNWNKDRIESSSSIVFNQLDVTLGLGRVIAKKAEVDFEFRTDLAGKIEKFTATLNTSRTSIIRGDKTYEIEKLNVVSSGEGGDVFKATIRAELKRTDQFPALNLKSTFEAKIDMFDFSGRISGQTVPFVIDVKGQHSRQGLGGNSRLELKPLTFLNSGLQPGDIWTGFPAANSVLTGTISAVSNVSWDAEMTPTAHVVAHMENMNYHSQSFNLDRFNVELETSEIALFAPFFVNVSGLSGHATADEKQLTFADGQVKIDIHKRWKNGDLELTNLDIKPVKGILFKPAITIQVRGTLRGRRIEMKGHAATDLLGQFADISGQYHMSEKTGAVEVNLIDIPFDLDGIELADLIHDAPDNLVITGDIGGALNISINGENRTSKGTFKLANVSIEQDGLKVQGLSGNIKFDALDPLTISRVQEMSASKISAGFSVHNPVLNFRLKTQNDAPVFYIDHLTFGVLGGSAAIRGGVVNVGANVNSLELLLFDLSLDELLALSDLNGVSATGQLGGKIPLFFVGEKLIIKEGVLESNGPGILKINSDKARQALSAGGAQTKLLFDVLENFNYSELSLKINKPASGEDVVTLHTKGANPKVENNRAIILNVNISTNLDRIFNSLLDGYRLSEKALRATFRNRNK